jgi:hypothetical protein
LGSRGRVRYNRVMSWAARRRLLYLTGVFLFFAITVGGPVAYHFLTIPATCHDGIQNQGETSPDHGGPCLLLDATNLQPAGILWARTFEVRSGLFDAVAYVNNPNQSAGVLEAPYQLNLYDSQNILVADEAGTAFIMPGGTTPVFVGGIDTGNRDAVHAQFQFTGGLVWERVVGIAQGIMINNQQESSTASSSEVMALATNTSVAPIINITFIATVFDPTGNAIASSQTALPRLDAGASQQIFFTWPSGFSTIPGRIDIIPVVEPVPDPSAQR